MTSMDEALSDRKDSATIDRKDTLTGTGAWSNAASSVFKRHSTPSPPQYKTYTLRRAGRLSSNYVVQHGTTTQLIVVSSWTGKPDIVLHIGDNKSSPVMAAAKFKTFSSNFRICLGDPNDSINTEWEDVVCEDTLKHAVYAFSLRTPAVSSLDAGPSMRKKFMWKRTHDSSLGAKKLSNRNFKLATAEDESVMILTVDQAVQHFLQSASGLISNVVAERGSLNGWASNLTQPRLPGRCQHWAKTRVIVKLKTSGRLPRRQGASSLGHVVNLSSFVGGLKFQNAGSSLTRGPLGVRPSHEPHMRFIAFPRKVWILLDKPFPRIYSAAKASSQDFDKVLVTLGRPSRHDVE
ncbi:hypothetical protein M8818_001762 [Zalaria obscura]|uniref:Uncharacterized protein n=1 Tax=Zalaria obscura TaxID=2024903 RepID=A0ACC3SLB2_9PEZI